MRRVEVAVVGAGIMGAATACALAAAGRDVLVIEQFQPGHGGGSSHGASRIFRYSYPEVSYVRMAMEARELWRALESRSGQRLLTETGGIDRGPRIRENAIALESCEIPCELLEGADLNRRFEGLTLPPGEPALYQPGGSVVAAAVALSAFFDLARSDGASVVSNRRVIRFEEGSRGVNLQTDEEALLASVVVVTAGAWAGPLLAEAGIDLPLRPTRETVAYFALERPLPTLVEWGQPSTYALASPGDGIKVGEHQAGATADPNGETAIDNASVERLCAWVAARFPGAAPRPHRTENCFYTNTPDEDFVLERRGRIVIGSPCSGHGFKFAPLIGQRLGALAGEIL
ncbi:MAG: FAD-dependent oxidoreductase [Dehalococcoidia bacterium]|nr:FAD-dependent oxidoreductase [Dehalococcoidia bacterium]